MNKVPCGGFELGDGFVVNDGKLGLAIPTLHITVTSLNIETMETTFTADKTVDEMYAVSGPTWCVITVPASVSPSGSEMVLEFSSYRCGYAFGYGLVVDQTSGIGFVVEGAYDGWVLNFKNYK